MIPLLTILGPAAGSYFMEDKMKEIKLTQGKVALEGERCELYADKICEGQRPYNYCKTCGSKEEI